MLLLPICEADGRPALRDARPVTISLARVPNRDRLELGPELFVGKSEQHHFVRLRHPSRHVVDEIGELADFVIDWFGFQDDQQQAIPCSRRAVLALFALRPDVMNQVRRALQRMSDDGILVFR